MAIEDKLMDALRETEAQRERFREALEELVRLKDGPRDEAYRRDKRAAWERARVVLGLHRHGS